MSDQLFAIAIAQAVMGVAILLVLKACPPEVQVQSDRDRHRRQHGRQGHDRTAISRLDGCDPDKVRGYIFYSDPTDDRVWVPRREGLGHDPNLATLGGKLLVGGMLMLPVAAIIFGLLWG